MPLGPGAINQFILKLNRAAENNWAGAKYHRDDIWFQYSADFGGELWGDVAPLLNGTIVQSSSFGSNLNGSMFDATGFYVWRVKTQRGEEYTDDNAAANGRGSLDYYGGSGTTPSYFGEESVIRLNEAYDSGDQAFSNFGGIECWVPEPAAVQEGSNPEFESLTNMAMAKALGWTFANNFTELLKIGRWPLAPQYHSATIGVTGRGFMRSERTLYRGAWGLYGIEWLYEQGRVDPVWGFPGTRAYFRIGFSQDGISPMQFVNWVYDVQPMVLFSVYGYRGEPPGNQYQAGGFINNATLIYSPPSWLITGLLPAITPDMITVNDSGGHVNLPCDGDPYIKPTQGFRYPGPIRVAGANGAWGYEALYGVTQWTPHIHGYSHEQRWDTVSIGEQGWKVGTVQM